MTLKDKTMKLKNKIMKAAYRALPAVAAGVALAVPLVYYHT